MADLTKQMEMNQVAIVNTPSPAQEGVNIEEGSDWEQANYIGNSSRQSYDPYSKTYNPGWKNHPNFGWRNQQDQGQDQRHHNPNQNNNAAYQHSTQRPYQHPPNNSSQLPYHTQNGHSQPSNLNSPSSSEDRLSRIETLLEGICKEVQDNRVFKDEVRANIKNQGDTIKRLESQVGYLSQQIPKPTDGFPSDTEKNPRGETKKRLRGGGKGKSYSRFLDMFASLHVNIPFIEALQQMPSYIKCMKELLTKKNSLKGGQTIVMNKECSALIKKELPTKKKDPGSFHIPCAIRETMIDSGLCDLGASINLMPLSLMKKLQINELTPTNVILQLADKTQKQAIGVVKNVLVKVGNYFIPINFAVLEMEESHLHPIILERPFLATARALIDVERGE
ncbi:uncharacterized protein LOC107465819 [Arachis duranensis]|uniref:Uncharacterized protein LOC107465819 n=1 Tax=Arachis duranensis TaxID=130453 RepID=A0A6P4BMZ6_ARADU|nr:uncharacterized protein LOC107465819 [Arachis duranensis]